MFEYSIATQRPSGRQISAKLFAGLILAAFTSPDLHAADTDKMDRANIERTHNPRLIVLVDANDRRGIRSVGSKNHPLHLRPAHRTVLRVNQDVIDAGISHYLDKARFGEAYAST